MVSGQTANGNRPQCLRQGRGWEMYASRAQKWSLIATGTAVGRSPTLLTPLGTTLRPHLTRSHLRKEEVQAPAPTISTRHRLTQAPSRVTNRTGKCLLRAHTSGHPVDGFELCMREIILGELTSAHPSVVSLHDSTENIGLTYIVTDITRAASSSPRSLTGVYCGT